METVIYTQARVSQRALATNHSLSNYPTIAASHTQPSGDGVLDLMANGIGNFTPTTVMVVPYGVGSDDDTFFLRLLGWKYTDGQPVAGGSANPSTRIYYPINLFEVEATLGTFVGLASMAVVATERFADTLAIVTTSGNPNVSMEMVSPGDNTVAHINCSLCGVELIQLIFTTGGVATSCNALVSLR